MCHEFQEYNQQRKGFRHLPNIQPWLFFHMQRESQIICLVFKDNERDRTEDTLERWQKLLQVLMTFLLHKLRNKINKKTHKLFWTFCIFQCVNSFEKQHCIAFCNEKFFLFWKLKLPSILFSPKPNNENWTNFQLKFYAWGHFWFVITIFKSVDSFSLQ